jgi:hypothetical protein
MNTFQQGLNKNNSYQQKVKSETISNPMMNFDPNNSPNQSSNQIASPNELSSQLMNTQQAMPQQPNSMGNQSMGTPQQSNSMGNQSMGTPQQAIPQQSPTGQMNNKSMGTPQQAMPQQSPTGQMNNQSMGTPQQPLTSQTNGTLQQPNGMSNQPTGTDQGSLLTSTDQGSLLTSTDQGSLLTSTDQGSLLTSTDQGSLPTGTDQGSLLTSTQPTGTPQKTDNEKNTYSQQITPSGPIDKHKYHYFVGYKMQNEAGRFKGLQRFLTNQLNIKNGKMVQDFHLRFAYLGYLDNSVLELFVDKILGSLLETVEKNICEISCTTSRVKIRKKVNSDYAKVVVNLDNDELDKIIKYLVKYGTSKVFDNYNEASVKSAHINLFTFSTKTNDVQAIRKKLAQLQSKKGNGKKVNPISFKVNKIEVLKGIPLVRRSGTPSKEDEMTIEVDTDFSYPLREC